MCRSYNIHVFSDRLGVGRWVEISIEAEFWICLTRQMFPGQPKKAVWTYYNTPPRLHLIYVSYPIYPPDQFNRAPSNTSTYFFNKCKIPNSALLDLGEPFFGLFLPIIFCFNIWQCFKFVPSCKCWMAAEKEEGHVWQQLMEVLLDARYFTFSYHTPHRNTT